MALPGKCPRGRPRDFALLQGCPQVREPVFDCSELATGGAAAAAAIDADVCSALLGREETVDSVLGDKGNSSNIVVKVLFVERVSENILLWRPCRNKLLLSQCFFAERFTDEYLDLVQKCGVKLACKYPLTLILG